jgi:hypothetical protein
VHTHAHTCMVGVSAWLPGDIILPWRSVFLCTYVCVGSWPTRRAPLAARGQSPAERGGGQSLLPCRPRCKRLLTGMGRCVCNVNVDAKVLCVCVSMCMGLAHSSSRLFQSVRVLGCCGDLLPALVFAVGRWTPWPGSGSRPRFGP